MFLKEAMKYYRMWIYSCNLALLISTLVFIILSIWTFADYHMELFPTIRLYQPSFLYGYVALILQGGILQVSAFFTILLFVICQKHLRTETIHLNMLRIPLSPSRYKHHNLL